MCPLTGLKVDFGRIFALNYYGKLKMFVFKFK